MNQPTTDRRPPDVLYLVHRVPYPPDKGDRIRAFHLLKYLARRATVHLACLADEPVPDNVFSALKRYCRRVAVVPLDRSRWPRSFLSFARGRTVTEGAFASPALRAVVRQWGAEMRFHAVLLSGSSMVPYLRLPELEGVRAVIDLVDVDSEKWLEYAAVDRGPRAWLYRREGRRLRRLEASLPSWVYAVTLVSEAEARLYRGFCDEGRVRAVPNGVDLDYFQPAPPALEPSCVFVGALDYRPNVDGACWFAREVWPAVHGRWPGSKLYLVGRRPAAEVLRLAEIRGVEVVGQVPDVRPHVARAAVSVNPLRIARGIQNKVLEAFAMGRATVSSPEALTGLSVRTGVHAVAASSPAEWIEAVSCLFGDVELCRRLGENGRSYVEEKHCWEICLEPFAPLLGLTPGPEAGSHGSVASDSRLEPVR
jgi:sugar transferase (PEP-CTERM/EpsH1 system associated)